MVQLLNLIKLFWLFTASTNDAPSSSQDGTENGSQPPSQPKKKSSQRSQVCEFGSTEGGDKGQVCLTLLNVVYSQVFSASNGQLSHSNIVFVIFSTIQQLRTDVVQ